MDCPICKKKVRYLRIYYTELLELDENENIKMTSFKQQILKQPDPDTDSKIGYPMVDLLCEDYDNHILISQGTQTEVDDRIRKKINHLPIKILEDKNFPSYLKNMDVIRKKIDEHQKAEQKAREEARNLHRGCDD